MIDRILRRVARRFYSLLKDLEWAELHEENAKLLACMKQCGRGVGLWGRMRILGGDQMVLGDNVHIGDNAYIRAEGGLVIGDNTHISRNLVLYTINHRTDGKRIPYDEEYVKKPVSIGRNVWIGMNVCITPGTAIGEGAIIGMGTVVSGDVPPMSILVGAQTRIIDRRDEEHYRHCDNDKAYAGENGMPTSQATDQENGK